MYRIVRKEALKPTVILYEIEAPMVAKKAEPGQFIILRVDEKGERIPITIHDYDREKGTVTIIVQTVGATTEKLSHKQQGDCLHDFVGPLGRPTETEGKKKVCVVGGGVGCAIAYPVLKKFHDCGAEVHAVVGFKSKDVVILEDKFKAVSSVLKVCTDDGSYGQKGLVTEAVPISEKKTTCKVGGNRTGAVYIPFCGELHWCGGDFIPQRFFCKIWRIFGRISAFRGLASMAAGNA